MDQLCKIQCQKIKISRSYKYFLLPHKLLHAKKCKKLTSKDNKNSTTIHKILKSLLLVHELSINKSQHTIKWDGIEVDDSYPNIILMHSPLYSSAQASQGVNYFKALQISGRPCATSDHTFLIFFFNSSILLNGWPKLSHTFSLILFQE